MLGGCDAGCSEVASSSSRRLVEVREKGLLMELGLLKMILIDGNLLEVPMLKGKKSWLERLGRALLREGTVV